MQDYIFCAIAQAPLPAPGDAKHVKVTIKEITNQMWGSHNFLANIKQEDGFEITSVITYVKRRIFVQGYCFDGIS